MSFAWVKPSSPTSTPGTDATRREEHSTGDTRKCQDIFLDHETCQVHHDDSCIDTYYVRRSCFDDQENKKEATIFDFEEDFVLSEHLKGEEYKQV